MVAAVAAPFAGASQLIDRNATGVQLAVNAKGEALLTYKVAARSCACSRGAPSTPSRRPPTRKQTALKLDYTGGWGKYYVADPA